MSETPLYQKIANEILEWINAGTFQPGYRIPGERELAAKFKVSRSVVREAQIMLQVQGKLDIKTGSGAYIPLKSEFRVYGIPEFEAFELTESRALIESESAALAAPIITDDAILKLEICVAIMSGKEPSDMTPEEAEAAFHKTIARSTKNTLIAFIVDTLWEIPNYPSQTQNSYRKVFDINNGYRADSHLAIVDALRDRNPIAARKTMRVHFTSKIETLLAESEKRALKELERTSSEKRSRFLLSAQMN